MIGTWKDRTVIGNSPYRILEVLHLPEDIQEELSNQCDRNDSGVIVNPEYHPKLKAWLKDNNNGNDTECFIAWWSW